MATKNKKFNTQEEYFSREGEDGMTDYTNTPPEKKVMPEGEPATPPADAATAPTDLSFTSEQVSEMQSMASSGDFEGLGRYVAGLLPGSSASAGAQ